MGTLYKSKFTSFWHMKISIEGKRRDISTKTKDYREAKRILKEYEDREKNKTALGIKHIPTLAEAIKHFLCVKQIKNSTWKIYKYSVEHLITAAGNKRIDSYSIFDYEKLIDYLRKNNFSESTKAMYTRHLSAVFNYYKRNEYIRKNPIKIIHKKEIPKPIDETDIQTITSYCRNNDYEFSKIVQFALLTGFRRSTITEEIVIDLEAGLIKAKNVKGNREFMFPIYKDLNEFLIEIGIHKYFIGRFTKLRRDSISHKFQRMMKLLFREGRIKNIYKFHQLRHSAATRFAEKLIDIKAVKDLLDHSDLRTSEKYIKTNLTLLGQKL